MHLTPYIALAGVIAVRIKSTLGALIALSDNRPTIASATRYRFVCHARSRMRVAQLPVRRTGPLTRDDG